MRLLLSLALVLVSISRKLSPVDAIHLRATPSNGTSLDIIALPAWTSSCKTIYLDLGSNIGVQIRKLYEPGKYPNATVVPIFDQYFGPEVQRRQSSAQSGLCALGFEPNPLHYTRLDQIEAAYLARGWHVHFFKAAVWSSNGEMTFTGVGDKPTKKDWGAKLKLHSVDVNVPTVDIATFVRTLPANSVKLMKMDIEGAEYECISHMLKQKTLCADTIGTAFAEAHRWGNTTHWVGAQDFSTIKWHVDQQQGCAAGVTNFTDLDDESYLNDVDDNFAVP